MEAVLALLQVGVAPVVLACVLVHIMTRKSRHPRRRYQKTDPFVAIPDEEDFRLTFRFTRTDVSRLAQAFNLPETVILEYGHKAHRDHVVLYVLYEYARGRDLCDSHIFFQRDQTTIGRFIAAFEAHVFRHCVRALADFHPTLISREHLEYYRLCIADKGCPYDGIWGFIDGCKWQICRPGGNNLIQRPFYSGYVCNHCVSYHVVSCPDGIIHHVFGPLPGRVNDLNVLEDSNLLPYMESRPGI
jgi:nuclease HARBI1